MAIVIGTGARRAGLAAQRICGGFFEAGQHVLQGIAGPGASRAAEARGVFDICWTTLVDALKGLQQSMTHRQREAKKAWRELAQGPTQIAERYDAYLEEHQPDIASWPSEKPRMGLLFFSENRARKCWASRGMSPKRSRSGGTASLITFKR